MNANNKSLTFVTVLDLTKRFTLVTLERDKLMFENKELKTQLSDLRVKPDFTTNSKLSIITQEEHLQEVQRLQQLVDILSAHLIFDLWHIYIC